jgi:rhamnogalacturonyl hydrolase YesR
VEDRSRVVAIANQDNQNLFFHAYDNENQSQESDTLRHKTIH